MSGPLVYLSGPISLTSYEGATEWYGEIREMLLPHIRVLEPMRGKEGLRGTKGPLGHWGSDDHRGRGRHKNPGGLWPIIGTRAGITGRDRWDVMRSDAVLMNLERCEGGVSIGAMIEAGWADAARVPLILNIPAGASNPHEGHAILEALAMYRTTELWDAAAAINALFPW